MASLFNFLSDIGTIFGKIVVLIFATPPPGLANTTPQDFAIGQFDFQSKRTTILPGSEGMVGPRLSPDGRYMSTISEDAKKMMLLELRTGKWSELAIGVMLQQPNWSLDSKYVYFEDLGVNGREIDRAVPHWRYGKRTHGSFERHITGPNPGNPVALGTASHRTGRC